MESNRIGGIQPYREKAGATPTYFPINDLNNKEMKIKWLGKTDFLVLTNNKIYDVISIERGWYRIIDDSGEDYLYHPDMFEIVEDDNNMIVK